MRPTKKILILVLVAVILVPIFWLGSHLYYRPLEIQRELLGTTIVSQAKWPSVDWSTYYLYGELRWTYKLSPQEEIEVRKRCRRPEEFKDKRRDAITAFQHLGICMIVARPLLNGKSGLIRVLQHKLMVSETPHPDPSCTDCRYLEL